MVSPYWREAEDCSFVVNVTLAEVEVMLEVVLLEIVGGVVSEGGGGGRGGGGVGVGGGRGGGRGAPDTSGWG